MCGSNKWHNYWDHNTATEWRTENGLRYFGSTHNVQLPDITGHHGQTGRRARWTDCGQCPLNELAIEQNNVQITHRVCPIYL